MTSVRPVGAGDGAAAEGRVVGERERRPQRTRTTEALVGGGGVLVPLGAASLFAEGRYTAFMGPGGGGYVPVVVGLRLGKF